MYSLSFTVPKFIVVKNTRLALFRLCVRLALVALLASSFFRSRQFADEVAIGQNMDVSMWVAHNTSAVLLEEIWADAAKSPFCRTPNIYDYWWDDEYKYETQGCKKLCEEGGKSGSNSACIDEHLYLRENYDQLLFITRQELSMRSGSKNSSAVFFPQVLAVRFGISFNYKVYVPQFDFPWFFGQQKLEHVGSSRRNVFTAIVDAKGCVNKTMEPKDTIEFSLSDLLWLSGIPDFLDEPDITKCVNRKPNATLKHPSGRVSGGMMSIRIHCSNTPHCRNCKDEKNELGKAWSSGVYDTMCILRVELGYDQWAYHETSIDASEGTGMTLSRQGLRVACQRDGAFEYWDGRWIFLVLSCWLVLLSMVDYVALMFIVKCFGLISSIYRRAIFETFDIRETVAGMAARLMVAGVTFDVLQDKQQQGITEDRAKAHIRKVFEQKHFQIDDRETNNLAAFCWEAQMEADGHNQSPLSGRLSQLSTQQSTVTLGPLDIDTFSNAFSNFERLKFNSLVKLFDRDRHKSLMETLVTPNHLSKAIARAQYARQGKQERDVTVSLSPAVRANGSTRQESQDNEDEPNERGSQTDAPRLPERNRTLAEEALSKAQEALAEVAGLRKCIDARLTLLEANITPESESRLSDAERKIEQLEAEHHAMAKKLRMNDASQDSLVTELQSKLSDLENLHLEERFEQLTENCTQFQNTFKRRLESANNKMQSRIGRLEDVTHRSWQREKHVYNHDVADSFETEDTSSSFVSDLDGSLREFQEWVVKKVADCMDDGRAACEALEEQIQHLAIAVSKLEDDMLAVSLPPEMRFRMKASI